VICWTFFTFRSADGYLSQQILDQLIQALRHRLCSMSDCIRDG
jgi:hypothetical protein